MLISLSGITKKWMMKPKKIHAKMLKHQVIVSPSSALLCLLGCRLEPWLELPSDEFSAARARIGISLGGNA